MAFTHSAPSAGRDVGAKQLGKGWPGLMMLLLFSKLDLRHLFPLGHSLSLRFTLPVAALLNRSF